MIEYVRLFNAKEAVRKLTNVEWSSGVTALRVKRFLLDFEDKIRPFLDIYEEAVRKYGKLDKETGKISIGPEEWKEFSDRVNEAGQEEVEWDVKPLLGEKELGDLKAISAKDVMFLENIGMLKDV